MSYIEHYTAARDTLLSQVVTALKEDERFVAAWLSGSFGRGTQDQFSDLDLHVVVADAFCESLCARPWNEGSRTTDERLALFQQFGMPTVIYEAHANAPARGTFTYVLYAENAINIDWMLIPQATARRECDSLLLFDHAGIPAEEPPAPESREAFLERVSKNISGFWMFASAGILVLIRHDFLHFHFCLEIMTITVLDVQASLKGERWRYRGKVHSTSYATLEEQVAALRRLCDQMEELMPAAKEMGVFVPSSPRAVVEMRLAMLQELKHEPVMFSSDAL